jgi:hypothetical protein
MAKGALRLDAAFDHVRADLHAEFDSRLPGETVDRCFAAEVAKFHDARITAYLPILILRNARARLRAMEARPLRLQL